MKFIARNKKYISMFLACMVVAALGAGMAFAESTGGTSTINSAVTTALGSVQSDALGLIAAVLPYALAIMGAIIVVMVGIRVFKRVAGR